MPDLPISSLPELTALTNNSEFAVASNGVTYKVKSANLSSGNLVGSFVSLSSQTASLTTVAYSMSADTTLISSGVTVVDGCKFTVASAGTFNIQFSAQVESTGGGNTQTVDIWLSKNGSNVDYTNTQIVGNSNNGRSVAAWNFVETNTTGGFFEIKWRVDDVRLGFVYQGPNTNPTRPAIPSVIVTVTQV